MTARLYAPTAEEIERFEKSEGFADFWTAAMIESGFNCGLVALGYKEGDETVCVALYTVGADFTDIEIVLTASNRRRQGYASALLQEVIARAKRDGTNKIFLEVRQGNVAAAKLYKSLGFAEISVRKKYYPDGEDATVMVKEL